MHFDRRQFVLGALGACLSTPVGAKERPAGTLDGFPCAELREDHTLAIRDDLGGSIMVRPPLTRLVVFNRYTAEFVRALSSADSMIGVGSDTAKDHTYWQALHAALVGEGQMHPNYEAIIALKPDAVIFPRNSEWDKARQVLAPFGIPVIVITAWDVLKHEANVTLLGQLLEKQAQAAKLNAFYRGYRDLLANRTADVKRKRVYFEEVGIYKTVLEGSGWHDMIETAGGVNIFGDVDGIGQPAARGNIQGFDVDPEEVLTRRPDIIVKLQPNQFEPHLKSFSADILNAIAKRPGFDDLSAVKRGEVFHMSYYLAGGCSKIVGALHIAKWLYPDRFSDIDPGEAMRVWLEEFQGVPYPGGYWISLAQIQA